MPSEDVKKITENPEVVKLVDALTPQQPHTAHVYYRDMEQPLDVPLRGKLFVVWDDDKVEITEQMQLACLRSIRAGDSRKSLELRHAPTLFGLLSAQCIYLDGPDQESWNWIMNDKGKSLFSRLAKKWQEQLDKLPKQNRCPLCESKSKPTKQQFTYGTLTDSGNLNGMKPGQVVLISLQAQGGRHVQDS